MGESTVIRGHAYQRTATIEVAGDTLTWRAQRGSMTPLPENIVTTIHDVRDADWIDRRLSLPGVALVALGVVWMVTSSLAWGAVTVAIGVGLLAWRYTRPRQYLVLELADRHLVLDVALPSAAAARSLVARIDRARESGEMPASPPALP